VLCWEKLKNKWMGTLRSDSLCSWRDEEVYRFVCGFGRVVK